MAEELDFRQQKLEPNLEMSTVTSLVRTLSDFQKHVKEALLISLSAFDWVPMSVEVWEHLPHMLE